MHTQVFHHHFTDLLRRCGGGGGGGGAAAAAAAAARFCRPPPPPPEVVVVVVVVVVVCCLLARRCWAVSCQPSSSGEVASSSFLLALLPWPHFSSLYLLPRALTRSRLFSTSFIILVTLCLLALFSFVSSSTSSAKKRR